MKKRYIIGASIVAAGIVAVGSAAAVGGMMRPAATLPAGFDGPVTQQIYDDAYAEFASCMNDNGAALVAEHDEGVVHEFSYRSDAQSIYDKCYVDFSGIDFSWQIANSYDSPTYVRLRECLTAIGVEPGKDAETVWAQVQSNKIDVFSCTLGVEEEEPIADP